MKLNKPNSAFYRWWNSYSGRRIVSATYSIGASVVILGALFKILHLPVGSLMLGVGMSVESLIFALGVFDKPYREYDWSKIFNFKVEGEEPISASMLANGGGGVFLQNGNSTTTAIPATTNEQQPYSESVGNNFPTQQPQQSGNINFPAALPEESIEKLSEGIKNLAETAESLQTLTSIALAANKLTQTIETASISAQTFRDTQDLLNRNAETLANSYSNVNSEMNDVVSNTRNYSTKVGEVNKNINSIDAAYQLQLRQVEAQTKGVNTQTEIIETVNSRLNSLASDIAKIKEATELSAIESERFNNATRKLTKNVENLNAVYGNMLNALS